MEKQRKAKYIADSIINKILTQSQHGSEPALAAID